MKKIALISSIMVAILCITGCSNTKTESSANADGTTTAVAETNEQNEATTVTESADSVDIVVSEAEEVLQPVNESEPVDSQNNEENGYQVIESQDGYTVTFNPEYFIYEQGGEYEGKESIYIRCTIDETNSYENFIDVSTVEGYTAEDLINGMALQNDTEATPMHIVFANGEYDAFYCEKKVADAFIISYYAIPGKDKPYLVEVGSHIYSDDDEYAYRVAGVMENTFLDLKFEQ